MARKGNVRLNMSRALRDFKHNVRRTKDLTTLAYKIIEGRGGKAAEELAEFSRDGDTIDYARARLAVHVLTDTGWFESRRGTP